MTCKGQKLFTFTGHIKSCKWLLSLGRPDAPVVIGDCNLFGGVWDDDATWNDRCIWYDE